MVFQIRWFEQGDEVDIFRIHSVYKHCFEDLEITPDYLSSISRRDDFRFAVACSGSDVVGFCGVLFQKPTGRAEIGPIAVSQDFVGLGIGVKLLDFMMVFLREISSRRLIAVIKSSNIRGVNFFEKYGFSVEANLKGFTRIQEDATQLVFFIN